MFRREAPKQYLEPESCSAFGSNDCNLALMPGAASDSNLQSLSEDRWTGDAELDAQGIFWHGVFASPVIINEIRSMCHNPVGIF